MIDKDGNLKCKGCNKKLGDTLNGSVEIVCPRCGVFNKFDSKQQYNSHKLTRVTWSVVYLIYDKDKREKGSKEVHYLQVSFAIFLLLL